MLISPLCLGRSDTQMRASIILRGFYRFRLWAVFGKHQLQVGRKDWHVNDASLQFVKNRHKRPHFHRSVKMIDRPRYLRQIQVQFDAHPVVAILGSRQRGKTTLARMYDDAGPLSWPDNELFGVGPAVRGLGQYYSKIPGSPLFNLYGPATAPLA
jgi:hypothetical protein